MLCAFCAGARYGGLITFAIVIIFDYIFYCFIYLSDYEYHEKQD